MFSVIPNSIVQELLKENGNESILNYYNEMNGKAKKDEIGWFYQIGNGELDNSQISDFFEIPKSIRNILGHLKNEINGQLSYDDYSQLRDDSDEETKLFLSAQLFAKMMDKDTYMVSSSDLNRNLLISINSQLHYSFMLSMDLIDDDNMTENDFFRYLEACTHNFKFTKVIIDENPYFEEFYVTYIGETICSQLDPLRTRNISIEMLFKSKIFEELLSIDPNEGINFSSDNLFSIQKAAEVLETFRRADVDNDGVLTTNDLMNVDGRKWTPSFSQALIDNAHRAGVPNFFWFVRIDSAWKNFGKSWANTILFDTLDIDHDGYISELEIRWFIKDHINEPSNKEIIKGREAVIFESLFNEIMDGYQEKTRKLSKDDFIHGGDRSFCIGYLVDYRVFNKNVLQQWTKPESAKN